MQKKFFIIFILAILLGTTSYFLGFTLRQAFIISIFSTSILGTLFLWELRLGFAFIGSSIMLVLHTVNLEEFVKYASLDVIWFLVGMMILVAMMKEAGVFLYIITLILRIRNLSGTKLFLLLCGISWILSGLMDEVTSILLVASIIFSLAEFLEVSPIPLILSCIMTTNIGSATTALGNPIGILIALRGNLSFEDFIFNALPVTFVCLIITTFVLSVYYRNYIKELTKKLKFQTENTFFKHLISISMDKKTKVSTGIFLLTILFISCHRRLEILLNLDENTLLVITPIIFAGIVLIYRYDKARYYVEHEIEWNTLLFFLFLFAQAGVLYSSGIAKVVADKMYNICKGNNTAIILATVFSSGLLSSMLDNIIVVSSYVPIVKNLSTKIPVLWWGILFGGCFGGNITMIGSTANIIVLSLLEKQHNYKIKFFDWFKIGLIVGIITMLSSAGFLLIHK